MRPPLAEKKALLEWTKRLVRRVGRPRKSLGQNFVVDPRLLAELASSLEGCRRVLEAGAGLGALTVKLASLYEYVVGVEIDPRFLSVLREIEDEHSNIECLLGDVLLLKPRVECVASNLPYSITGPFFAHLAKTLRPQRAALTVQREVARRLAARPGTSAYGRLSIIVQLVYNVKLGSVYPPTSFYPPPDVYSQIVVLEKREDAPSPAELEAVERLTRCLFSQRNKLADKVVKRCCRGVASERFGERRVYELTPREVLSLVRECD